MDDLGLMRKRLSYEHVPEGRENRCPVCNQDLEIERIVMGVHEVMGAIGDQELVNGQLVKKLLRGVVGPGPDRGEATERA